jgi:hypothetical protein
MAGGGIRPPPAGNLSRAVWYTAVPPMPAARRDHLCWFAAFLVLATGACARGAPGPAGGPSPGGEGGSGGSGKGGRAVDAAAGGQGGRAMDAAVDRGARVDVTLIGPDASAACGSPGQPCCDGTLCGGGGCCVRCQCVGPGQSCGLVGGTCSNGSCGACGNLGQACCPGSRCTAPGVECLDGTCKSCGMPGQRCCNASTCVEPGTACSSGTVTCVNCGEPGNPCCPGSTCKEGGCCFARSCIAQGAVCSRGGGEPAGTCKAGRCSGCGQAGQKCCWGDKCDDPTLACGLGGICNLCGGPQEPCCSLDAADRCGPGLACVGSTCEPCGGPGQPCCRGSECRGGSCCLGEFGQLCVGEGDSCGRVPGNLPWGGTCQAGKCQGCGEVNQPCCHDKGTSECKTEDLRCYRAMDGKDMCGRCGRPGERCCDVYRCLDGGCCVEQPGTRLCVAQGGACPIGGVCGKGSCGSCGGHLQPCCSGDTCTAPDAFCSGVVPGKPSICLDRRLSICI